MPRGYALVHEHVVHDGEEPRAEIGAGGPQPALFPCARQGLLDQVVGAMNIAGQYPRITPQPRQRGQKVGLRQRGVGT